MLRYCLLLLFLFAHGARAASHCVIFQYHHFSEHTPPVTSITPQQFDDQLDYLKHNGFTVMALRDVALSIEHQLELPDKCVSLTVDDAYISVYTTAYPRLKKLGWPFTVFVNTAAVDQGLKNVMNWDQIREMSKHGVSFENHGHDHIHMIRRKENETEREWFIRIALDIKTAQQRIIDETGIAPVLFAYPYGEFNPSLLKLIDKLNLTGFAQQSGPAWPGAISNALPRFPMAANYAKMNSFITKANTLPLPVIHADPLDPLVEAGNWRPTLILKLAAGTDPKKNLRCYVNGSHNVKMVWSGSENNSVAITPGFDLKPGRHRTNCTMLSTRKGRFYWYSQNWFIRNKNGSWYAEY